MLPIGETGMKKALLLVVLIAAPAFGQAGVGTGNTVASNTGTGKAFSGNENSILHRIEVFGGYSYQRFDVPNSQPSHINMNGFAFSGNVNLYKWLGAEGDFFGNYASNCGGATGLNCHDFTYGGGPRLTYRTKRTALFGHVLVGGNHSAVSFSGLSGSDNSLALLGGGGVDYQASSHFGIRLGQFDYLMTQHGNNAGVPRQNNLMYSAGAIFWF
jgi:hypothetical protein